MKKTLFLSILLLSISLVHTNIAFNIPTPPISDQYFASRKNTAFLLQENLNVNHEPCVHYLFAPTEGNPNYGLVITCPIRLTPEEYKKYMAALVAIEIQKADDKKTDTENTEDETQQQES